MASLFFSVLVVSAACIPGVRVDGGSKSSNLPSCNPAAYRPLWVLDRDYFVTCDNTLPNVKTYDCNAFGDWTCVKSTNSTYFYAMQGSTSGNPKCCDVCSDGAFYQVSPADLQVQPWRHFSVDIKAFFKDVVSEIGDFVCQPKRNHAKRLKHNQFVVREGREGIDYTSDVWMD